MATRTFDPQELIDDQVAQINETLEKIEARMAKYHVLNEKKQRLLAARRALLGGNRLTGEGGTRVRLEDIIDFLKDNPGAHPTQMAERFGVAISTVSSHLYRHKGRFEKDKDGGYHNVNHNS